jgi:hypothetical protein
MTLKIKLPPDLEHRLRRAAKECGMEADAYVRQLLERQLRDDSMGEASLWETLSPEEWIRETREWIETHRDWPVLPPGADDRSSIYEEREP